MTTITSKLFPKLSQQQASNFRKAENIGDRWISKKKVELIQPTSIFKEARIREGKYRDTFNKVLANDLRITNADLTKQLEPIPGELFRLFYNAPSTFT